MEDPVDRLQHAKIAEAALRKPRVHSHVAADHAHVRTPLASGAIDLGLRHTDTRLRLQHVGPARRTLSRLPFTR